MDLFGTFRRGSYLAPSGVVPFTQAPATVAAGQPVWLMGSNLAGAAISLISESGAVTDISGWAGAGSTATRVVLLVPSAASSPPGAPPDPGRYQVQVGDDLAPLSVAAYVDPGTSPVLASQPSITITGQGFVAGATEVSVGAIPVPASQISVSPAGTSLTFTTPSGAARHGVADQRARQRHRVRPRAVGHVVSPAQVAWSMAATPVEPDGAEPSLGVRLFLPGTDDPGQREPDWLGGVRLRAARRVLWLRELWSSRYEGEHLLAISHSEVDRALMPPGDLLAAEQAFYRADTAAAALSRAIDALAGAPPTTPGTTCGPRWGRVRRNCTSLPSAWPGPPIPRCCASSATSSTLRKPPGPPRRCRWRYSGTRRSGARDPTRRWSAGTWPAQSATGETRTPPRPAGKQTRSCSRRCCGTGSDPAAADWSAGTLGTVVEQPGGLPLRPDSLEAIVAFIGSLPAGREGLSMPVEIELMGAPGSGRTSLAAHVVAALGQPGRGLVAVDAAAIAAGPDPTDRRRA